MMDGSFNGQILVDKLTKLNSSQQSIETLSHWCIFHRNKAKHVVETWERQFHCSPREQRVSFLYLANDILQNSRRKGLEFINEFWRVLPDALKDVYRNGGEFGRSTVLRLIGIWEERKVFGSHVQVLKDELLGRRLDSKNRIGKTINYKLKQPAGELMEKIISSYEHVCNLSIDEDAVFGRFQSAISFVEKADEELGSIDKSEIANTSSSEVARDLQMHYGILRESVEQLKVAESSRATLISYLREALNEQETKVEQVRHQLQATQLQYKHAASICQKFNIGQVPPEQRPKESSPSVLSDSAPPGFGPESATTTGEKSQMTTIKCTQEDPHTINNPLHNGEEQNKAAAATVADKLMSSPSSTQMLSYAFSSLSSDGVGQTAKDDCQYDNKRPKIENNMPSQLLPPQPLVMPLLPTFLHPDSMLHPPPQPPSPISPRVEPPPPPPSLPPPPPPPPPPPLPPSNTQFMPPPGPVASLPYNYGTIPPPLPNYPIPGMPPYPGSGGLNSLAVPNPYSFQTSEGVNFFSQPPFPPAPPPFCRQ